MYAGPQAIPLAWNSELSSPSVTKVITVTAVYETWSPSGFFPAASNGKPNSNWLEPQ